MAAGVGYWERENSPGGGKRGRQDCREGLEWRREKRNNKKEWKRGKME